MRAVVQEQGNAGRSITSSAKTPRKPSYLDMRPCHSSSVPAGWSGATRALLALVAVSGWGSGKVRQGLKWGQPQGEWQSRMSQRMSAVRDTSGTAASPGLRRGRLKDTISAGFVHTKQSGKLLQGKH